MPDTIGNLTQVKILRIGDNSITILPDSIGDLKYLRALESSRNQLTSLPDTLGEAWNLQFLWLGGNQFTEFPAEMFDIRALKETSLADNQIVNLPDEVIQLRTLEQLDLSNNQIRVLPVSLATPQVRYTTINFSGNQLEFPPQEIADEGMASILKYLRNPSPPPAPYPPYGLSWIVIVTPILGIVMWIAGVYLWFRYYRWRWR